MSSTGVFTEPKTTSEVTWEPSGTVSSSTGSLRGVSDQAVIIVPATGGEVVQSPVAVTSTQGGFMDQYDQALKEPLATPCAVGSNTSNTTVVPGITRAVNTSISKTSTNNTIVVPIGGDGSTPTYVTPEITHWRDDRPTVRNVNYKQPVPAPRVFNSPDEFWLKYLQQDAKLQSRLNVSDEEWKADRWAPGWITEGVLPSELWINRSTETRWKNLPYLKQVNDQSAYKNATSARYQLYSQTTPYGPLYVGYDSPYIQKSGVEDSGNPVAA